MKAMLVIKNKEPKVISIKEGSYKEISNILKESLSDNERKIADFNGVESFCTGLKGVLGYVEEFSALHPYERNREWHGPAIFIEYDMEGHTISMSDENIFALKDMFSLDSAVSSPSEYINNFLDKYAQTITHNVSIGSKHGILNTMDAVNFLKSASNPDDIGMIISVFKQIEDVAKKGEFSIEEILADYLKEMNVFLFSKSIKNDKFGSIFD